MAILKILLLTILTYIIGALWFSKLFGKTWSKIHHNHNKEKTPEDMKKEKKSMWKLMTAEFISTFIINFMLFFIAAGSASLNLSLVATIILWLGFILPITVSNIIWGCDERKYMIKKIAISSGYRLLAMLITVWVLFVW